MSEQLPLSQLYDPLMVMFRQIDSYENLFTELETRQKDQRKQKFIIEKLIAMQEKKQVISNNHIQQLELEKQEFDILYQQSHLTREQHKHLINQDIEVDQQFYQIYKILEEQEKLAKDLIQYDDPNQQGPSPLRASLIDNIDLIRQSAQSKIISHLKKHYEIISIDELKLVKQLFKVDEQIVFVLRFKFSHQIVPLLSSLNSQDENSMKQFLVTLDEELCNSYNNIKLVFDDQETQIFPQVIDNICQDYVQQLDATLKFVENYYLIFDLNNLLLLIINHLIETQAKLVCIQGFQKLITLCSSLKTKNVSLITHNLQIIRFNISQFSSYQPLKEQLDQWHAFLQKNQPNDREEILQSLWQPFKQLIQLKLQQNNYNRSSKIFSINALTIIIEKLKQFEFPEQQDLINNYIEESKTLLNDLLNKLKIENVNESAAKFKVQQREKSTQITKDQFKRLLRQIVQLDENGFRNDLFFEIELIAEESIKFDILKGITECINIPKLVFTTEYYGPLYENLQRYLTNQQTEFTTEIIQQLCSQYSITTKDIHRIPLYIRDPDSYKLSMLNNQSL